jgi:hypothetical protein
MGYKYIIECGDTIEKEYPQMIGGWDDIDNRQFIGHLDDINDEGEDLVVLYEDCAAENEQLKEENTQLKEENKQLKLQQNTTESESRIAELEAQVQQATAEKEVLKKQVEEYRKQQKAGEMQEIRNDEWIVELLAHLCYEDEQVARSILDEIRGKEDPVIADIILERKQRNQISPKTQNRELWRILHAAKLYRGIEGNFNTALRRRQ